VNYGKPQFGTNLADAVTDGTSTHLEIDLQIQPCSAVAFWKIYVQLRDSLSELTELGQKCC